MINRINFICFSKNRPMQLDGYLRSVFKHIKEIKNHIISVIYTCDDIYLPAYKKIQNDFNSVNFIWQNDFYTDLINTLNYHDTKLICFGCDDVVFTEDVYLDDVGNIMTMDSDCFSFSFRLGRNIKKSMFYGDYPYPNFLCDGSLLKWDLHTSHHSIDFGYSFELNGTVYFTDIIKSVIEEFKPTSPNILEAGGGGRWSKLTSRRFCYSYRHSKLVVPTVNTIQTNFPTKVLFNINEKLLLEMFNVGIKIDINKYANIENDCIHIKDFYLTNTLDNNKS